MWQLWTGFCWDEGFHSPLCLGLSLATTRQWRLFYLRLHSPFSLESLRIPHNIFSSFFSCNVYLASYSALRPGAAVLSFLLISSSFAACRAPLVQWSDVKDIDAFSDHTSPSHDLGGQARWVWRTSMNMKCPPVLMVFTFDSQRFFSSCVYFYLSAWKASIRLTYGNIWQLSKLDLGSILKRF